MKNVMIKKRTDTYKPSAQYVFESKTYKSIIESISFWFTPSGPFIELSVNIVTVDRPHAFEITYAITLDEAKEYINDPESFLINNFKREDVDTNTPILTKEKAIEETIDIGVNVVFR